MSAWVGFVSVFLLGLASGREKSDKARSGNSPPCSAWAQSGHSAAARENPVIECTALRLHSCAAQGHRARSDRDSGAR